jgi:hypothetical protein
MPDSLSTDYINSPKYDDVKQKLAQLWDVLNDLTNKSSASRKLRYAQVDIEAEREQGRLLPDELFIPQHIIDTNIRREQPAYVQYVTQSQRAVICVDQDDSSVDLQLLETDLTKKLRFDNWETQMFSCIDGMQANAFGVMEIVYKPSNPGHAGFEYIPLEDFAFITDTKDIQTVEYTARRCYFTRTRLLALCGDPENPDPENDWKRDQVDKVMSTEPDNNETIESNDAKDKSNYQVQKYMFRINGIVYVAWGCYNRCDDWLRDPRPLFIGRRKLKQIKIPMMQGSIMPQMQPSQPNFQVQVVDGGEDTETQYPYILFPYLISENPNISQLKGRIFLDQDLQEGVTSLISSLITKTRMLMFLNRRI